MNDIEIITTLGNICTKLEATNQSITAMYISGLAVIVTFVCGVLNYRMMQKGLKIQAEKAYREIITAERARAYNCLREGLREYLDSGQHLVNESFKWGKKGVEMPDAESIESLIAATTRFNSACNNLSLLLTAEEVEEIIDELEKHAKLVKNVVNQKTMELYYSEGDRFQAMAQETLQKRWAMIEQEARIYY
jgi:hypothetical protein